MSADEPRDSRPMRRRTVELLGRCGRSSAMSAGATVVARAHFASELLAKPGGVVVFEEGHRHRQLRAALQTQLEIVRLQLIDAHDRIEQHVLARSNLQRERRRPERREWTAA